MPPRKQLSVREKKDLFLKLTQGGMARTLAAWEAQTSLQGINYYRGSDAEFRRQDDEIKTRRAAVANARDGASLQDPQRRGMISFQRFCEEYLDTKLFNHHLQWLDLLEGRDPRNLHPSAQIYEKSSPDFIMVNTPPEHSKSTTITINYVTYRICEDPNVRIIIVSQTQEMAKRFLRGIKDRLASTNQAYRKLQIDFAPDGGFDKDSAAWTSDSIYVSSNLRDSGEPTPTVLALGLGGQIYGNRADLIIFDDTVTGKNAHEYAKQMDWMQREVYNRLSPTGKMLLIGTRLAPNDLYSEIRKSEYYNDEGSPWTYLTQPAVLEVADDPKDWVTLWPKTNRKPVSLAARNTIFADEDGLYPMWDGPALAKRRSSMGPRNWALVYQQEDVVEDATFPQKDVVGCIDGMRAAGPMVAGAVGHRDHGQDGCYVIGGFDPAISGHSAAVVMAVDRMSGVRWVMDVWTRGHLRPEDIFDKIKEWTLKYRVNEWRIEKNAMNMMVTQDRPLNEWMATRGVKISEHFTGANKWDADFGVASMSMLFKGHDRGANLIRLPSRSANEGVKALVEQLTTWEPTAPGQRNNKRKTDTVMALWFAEIRARELVNEMNTAAGKLRITNPYMSERDQGRRFTVDLDHMANQQIYGNDTKKWWGR